MATLAELQDALMNAHKAGDTASAQKLADAITSMGKVQEAKPASVQFGEGFASIPRQLGLTARYALEGPAQAAQIVTEPLRQFVTDPLLRAFNPPKLSDLVLDRKLASQPLGETASKFADYLGLPQPEGANERVIGDATRLVSGAGGLGMAGRSAQATPGLLGKLGEFFATKPAQQAMSAAGAGLAGGSAREAGADPLTQAGASLLGGVGAPLAGSALAGGARKVGQVAKNAADFIAPGSVQTQNVDQQITLTLRQQGINWAEIPERIKQPMRADVAEALQTGQNLNPDAMRRLLDFRTVGATPTRGMLTQDPVQITKERNLAKTGANSADIGLQRLPQLENQNTARLLSVLDDAGARGAPDSVATGQRLIDFMNSRVVTPARDNINSLYSQARDTSGRSAPLDNAAFTTRANQALDEALLGGALPPGVATHMNRIATGEVPFTVDYAEQLKTAMGKLQRASNDGQTRAAIGVVRRALDDTPLRASPKVNPGNLPAIPGTVPPSQATMGADSINAFNSARRANAEFMGQVERNPALQAVVDGVEPDKFVRNFITGSGANVSEVQSLGRAIGADPATRTAVQQNIVSHLRSAATGGTDDVTKFSQFAYTKALNNIGERKLSALFDAEQLRQLQAVGRVGTLMSAQPAGSAVNNSNSGALVLGKALGILDSVAGKMPLGIDTTIQGIMRGAQQGRALSVPKALALQQPRGPLSQALGMPAIYGSLLATQPVNEP